MRLPRPVVRRLRKRIVEPPGAETAHRFQVAWSAPDDDETGEPELLPGRLARVCRAAVSADGAGLSVMSGGFRVPLGASDNTSSLAERLQFTQGEGPCLDSASSRRRLVSSPDQLHRRWPSFAAELFARTPFRSVLALPIDVDTQTQGALDLFFIDAAGAAGVTPDDSRAVTDRVAAELAKARHGGQAGHDWSDVPELLWLQGSAATDRSYVWVAAGMVMTRGGSPAHDAMALLRAYAYSHDTTVDAIARALIDGSLDLDQLEV